MSLFAIAFGLSWRARLAQERWTRLISVETKAVAALEELIRAQNAFHARYQAGQESPQHAVFDGRHRRAGRPHEGDGTDANEDHERRSRELTCVSR